MDLIILTDGLYHLVPVTKAMVEDVKLFAEVDCFELCDILRIKLTKYNEFIYKYSINTFYLFSDCFVIAAME